MNVFPNTMSKNNGSILIYSEDHLGQAGPELFFLSTLLRELV